MNDLIVRIFYGSSVVMIAKWTRLVRLDLVKPIGRSQAVDLILKIYPKL